MKIVVCAVLLLVVYAAGVQAQTTDPVAPAVPAAVSATESDDETGVRFVFTSRPSLRVGSWLRIDFRLKLQGDLREFDPAVVDRADGFEMNRRRVGIEGTVLRYVEYELERELRKENVWRDAFVNFRYFDNIQLRAGKFKVPFSLEQLTSPTNLDFVYRSNMVNSLSPARDIGASLHGQFFRRALGYDAGVFQGDGENARFDSNPGAERTVAARATVRPLRLTSIPGNAREMTLGVAMTSGEVPEGLNSLRGETVFGERFVAPVYVRGRRLRLGLEADWQPGPFSVKAEFMRVTDQRKNQGVTEEDLPPIEARGWYVSGTWLVTGESKLDGIAPRRPLFRGGAGALELATRYERLEFGSSFDGENDSTSPRGANLLETSDRAWTVGLNWFINRWTKFQVNLVREWVVDPGRGAIPDRRLFWTRLYRIQFVL